MGFEDRQYKSDYNPGSGPKFIFPMPSKFTFALIIACVAMFFVQSFYRPVTYSLALVTFDHSWLTQPWRWITYQYLHGGGGHLFFNLIGIYFFVPPLEARWGWKRTLAFYTAGGVVAGLCFFLISSLIFHHAGILIGASGSIFAVLGALTLLAPDMQILAMMIIPITMRTLTLLYTVFFIFTVVGDRDPADAAHLGGLAFGFLAPYLAGPALDRYTRGRRQRRMERQQSAVIEEEQTIDAILQKVHDHGMNSLSGSERRALKRATERQRQRDLANARRGH